jgi:exodeoxyribonuclease VII large subunit
MLFPALLQGENAVGSIMKQMERISLVKQHFDMVAIIRGGGGDIGLACYNNYELAKAIALFPLPVITGIGHSTNETVSEMVAFRNTITPTELADYLLQKFHNFSVPLRKAQDSVIDTFSRLLKNEKSAILNLVRFFKSTTNSRLAKGKHEINSELKYMRQQSAYFIRRALEKNMLMNLSLIEKSGAVIKEQWSNIAIAEKSVELLNPMNVLNRGYSITMVDGGILKTVDSVREGAIVKTILSDGNVISIAQSVTKNENNG